MLLQPELAPPEGRLSLPPHASTVTAEDLRIELVLAADQEMGIVVDASAVESIGQAVLQLLVAAREEADRLGQSFEIRNPSPAFLQRVIACRLSECLNIQDEEVSSQ